MPLKPRTPRCDGVSIPSGVCRLLACLPATNTYVTGFMGEARPGEMKCWFTSQELRDLKKILFSETRPRGAPILEWGNCQLFLTTPDHGEQRAAVGGVYRQARLREVSDGGLASQYSES